MAREGDLDQSSHTDLYQAAVEAGLIQGMGSSQHLGCQRGIRDLDDLFIKHHGSRVSSLSTSSKSENDLARHFVHKLERILEVPLGGVCSAERSTGSNDMTPSGH